MHPCISDDSLLSSYCTIYIALMVTVCCFHPFCCLSYYFLPPPPPPPTLHHFPVKSLSDVAGNCGMSGVNSPLEFEQEAQRHPDNLSLYFSFCGLRWAAESVRKEKGNIVHHPLSLLAVVCLHLCLFLVQPFSVSRPLLQPLAEASAAGYVWLRTWLP